MDAISGTLLRGGAGVKMNPYDLYAVETALRLREQYGGHIQVLTMGPPQAETVIREAFSMGVDSGAILTDPSFAGADVLATSYTLSQGVRKLGHYDLIICGKQTTDGDTAQVGQEIAEFLGIPGIANTRRIVDADDRSITVEMDMQDEVMTLKAGLPCLLTVEKDIFQPRLPSYRKKLETKERPIPRIGLQDLEDQDALHYGLDGSPTSVVRIFPPPSGTEREIWRDSGEALANALFERLAAQKFIRWA